MVLYLYLLVVFVLRGENNQQRMKPAELSLAESHTAVKHSGAAQAAFRAWK